MMLARTVLSLGGGLANASESLPSPTLLVTLYAALWLGLVGWIAWLATRQHSLDRDARDVQSRLQARLDRDDPQD